MTSTPSTTSTSRPVGVGDRAPDFELRDQRGEPFRLSGLRGRPVVLYFYPRDNTPGCTVEACAFRDDFEDFTAAGAAVVGVSADTPDSHAGFAERFRLPFTLLSDPGDTVRRLYGVPASLFGLMPGRVTYVLDRDGVVRRVFNSQLRPKAHVAEALRVIRAMPGA